MIGCVSYLIHAIAQVHDLGGGECRGKEALEGAVAVAVVVDDACVMIAVVGAGICVDQWGVGGVSMCRVKCVGACLCLCAHVTTTTDLVATAAVIASIHATTVGSPLKGRVCVLVLRQHRVGFWGRRKHRLHRDYGSRVR